MKLNSLLTILFIVGVFLCPSLLHAQGGPGDPGQDPDIKIPFDGGLSLLIAAGVGYGMKKAYDKRKADKNAPEAENKM